MGYSVHVCPPRVRRTGVRSWAERMHPYLAEWCDDLRLAYADELDRDLANISRAIIETGANEAETFFQLQRLIRAGVKCSVVVHDPPRLSLSKWKVVEAASSHQAGRAFRKAVNWFLEDWVDRSVAKHVLEWIVLSHSGADRLEKRLAIDLGISSPKIIVVPHGLYPCVQRREHKNNGVIRVGMFGHLGRSKGFDILVDAFLAISSFRKDLQLTISGSPDSLSSEKLLQQITKQIQSDSVNTIKFLPAVPDEQLPELIDSFDILAIPYRNLDSVSASGPMAWGWTRGCPIASTPTAYAKEILGNGGGWLLDGAEVEDWIQFLRGITLDDVLGEGEQVRRFQELVGEEVVRKAWLFLAE